MRTSSGAIADMYIEMYIECSLQIFQWSWYSDGDERDCNLRVLDEVVTEDNDE